MELKKFHVADGCASSVCHGDSIAGRNRRICRVGIHLSSASGSEKHSLGAHCLERAVGREHGNSCNSVTVHTNVGSEFEFGKGNTRNVLGTRYKSASDLTARRVPVCMQNA